MHPFVFTVRNALVFALCLALVGCKPETKPVDPAPPAPEPAPASGQPQAALADSAAAKPEANPPAARCKVTEQGKTTYDGRCVFRQEGGNGSFSVTPLDQPAISGANPVTVTILEPGKAEVRGLTSEGINSRWGEARRSATDGACWDGEGFSLCVHAAAASAPSAPTAACEEGATRCEGTYAGKVKPGNNPPLGAQVMVCTGGAWSIQQVCDAGKDLGCYVVDDPATQRPAARCLSAMGGGE